MGLLIGAHSSGGAAPAFANLIYLPMIYLSGMFIPLPPFMQKFQGLWPAYYLDQLALSVAGGDPARLLSPTTAAAVLLAVTLLCGGIAIRRLARKG
jgi:ABC-2 type transport system permease protein